MNILAKLEEMVRSGHLGAIALVMEMVGTVKIVSLTEDQVARLVELVKKKGA